MGHVRLRLGQVRRGRWVVVGPALVSYGVAGVAGLGRLRQGRLGMAGNSKGEKTNEMV